MARGGDMKRAIVLLALTASSCGNPGGPDIPPIPSSPNPLAGYKIMTNPRASVPVGAVWIQLSGPNGAGAPADNLQVDDGVSSATFTANSNPSMVFAIANLFGLSASQAQNLSVTMTGVETTRVKDVFALGIPVGQNILYEALKVETMRFAFSRNIDASVELNFRARGAAIESNTAISGNRVVTIDSSNLFIAYRVMKMETLATDVRNVLVDGTANDMLLSASGYQISAEGRGLQACACAAGSLTSGCLAENPLRIRVTDPSGMTLNSDPPEKEISYFVPADYSRNYPLWSRFERELPTGTVYTVKYMTLALRPELQSLGDSCEVRFPPGGTGGRITEAYVELKPFAEASAPSW